MDASVPATSDAQVTLHPVDQSNWRAIANLKVFETQREFVAEPCSYLALCCYGQDWQPLAICLGDQVIGFMMWSTDPADGSCWLGGILIDRGMQRHGYGRQAIQATITMLNGKYGHRDFALSYQPANLIAKRLYSKLGFIETDEWEDDEIVARLSLPL
jgi:diamine N-acetyltransferase